MRIKNETNTEELKYEILKRQDNDSSIVKIKLLFNDPDIISSNGNQYDLLRITVPVDLYAFI